MRIAVINEVSASIKNSDIMKALEGIPGVRVLNVGMKKPDEQPGLTYIHTSYMAAALLNTGSCDFVVGGCGTGQGFLNAVLQFPGIFCGLVSDPLDAWLFSQINGGNCVSLPLNKGYGWAGDINLKYVFEKLFADPAGQGYPLERAESQALSRSNLQKISRITHADFPEILRNSDPDVLRTIASCPAFMKALKVTGETAAEVIRILEKSQLPNAQQPVAFFDCI